MSKYLSSKNTGIQSIRRGMTMLRKLEPIEEVFFIENQSVC